MKIAIYYHKSEKETSELAVSRINELIQLLEVHHIIKGVFIDRHNEGIELMELLNSPVSELDYIYFNKPLENDFDRELVKQLLKTEHFRIKYFNEI